jgi:hypothetical protein
MRRCKVRLASIWIVGSLCLFAVIIAQSLGGKFGSQVEVVWSWFLPTVMPSLSLVVGVLVADASGKEALLRTVDRFVLRVAESLSIFYLLLVAATFLAQPLTQVPALDLMKRSNLWLGPFQGVVAAALGIFFSREGADRRAGQP